MRSVPTSVATYTLSGRLGTRASSMMSVTPGRSRTIFDVRMRWYTASMLCVLPPPKAVFSSTTGSPSSSSVTETRLSTLMSSDRMPSVIKVREKNSLGSWYSKPASPFATLARSSANSAVLNCPRATSALGATTLRQGRSAPDELASVEAGVTTLQESAC